MRVRDGSGLSSDEPLFLEVVLKDFEIPAIRFEPYIEEIADKRHRPDYALNRDVGRQSSEYMAWDFQSVRFIQQVSRQPRCGHIADSGHKPQDRFDTKADIRTGQNECSVEELRQHVDALECCTT